MFDTPKEAALRAENARLKAENDYLRRAVGPCRAVGPYCVDEEVLVSPASVRASISLPLVAGVEADLKEAHRWGVYAWADRIDGGKVAHGYYIDRASTGFNDDRMINEVLPRMHERMMRSLAEFFMEK